MHQDPTASTEREVTKLSLALLDELERIDTRKYPVHFSNLKHMAASPAHYVESVRADIDQTPSMRIGTAIDAALFGTANVVQYDGRRDKRVKAWQSFSSAHVDDVILTPAEFERVKGMARSIRRNRRAMDLLGDGNRQQTLSWRIQRRDCEGTPDTWNARRVVELKSSQTSHPDWFVRQARRMFYHAQLAWYCNALLELTAAQPEEAYVVAVESKRPYPTTVFQLTDEALDQGTRLWRLWWERLRVCEESGEFPEYSEAICPFDVYESDDGEGFGLIVEGKEVTV